MKSLSNLITLLVIAALTLLAGPASAVVYYVDGANGTDPNDGLTWDTAKATIQAAVDAAGADDEIWVRAGTYAISSQIQVNEAIGIYGGFAGSETERSQRDWATNTTTIDGQDSTRILKIDNETIIIDGFTLTNGYYDASSTFSGGGAINIGPGTWDKTPRISNCIISNNIVYSNSIGPEGIKGGGAIYVGTGNPLFVNCLITNNSTNAYGGGINIYSGSPDFINCTISKNSAVMGGGLYMQGKDTVIDAQFYNCIISGNTDANDVKVQTGGDEPHGSNNCSSAQIGTGTILADPLFIDPNDFHLQASSPCIDAGDSNSVPSDVSDLDGDGDPNEPVPFDLDGGPRFINGTYADESPLPHADIGAYEFELPCGNGQLPYPTGDINFDCGVDLIDYAIFTLCWLTDAGEPGWNTNCNLYDADLTIDIYDLDVLGENWLNFHLLQPVGYWAMDDDANNMTVLDSSGNGNHGTARQNTEYISTAGMIDGALTFNGTSDYVDCGNNSSLQITGNLSISAWVRTSLSSVNRQFVVCKDDLTNRSYSLFIEPPNAYARFQIFKSDLNYFVDSTTSINDGQWHHIVGINNGTDLKIYVDGTLEGTNSGAGGAIDNDSADVYIGVRSSHQYYFNGTIDDVKVFDSVVGN